MQLPIPQQPWLGEPYTAQRQRCTNATSFYPHGFTPSIPIDSTVLVHLRQTTPPEDMSRETKVAVAYMASQGNETSVYYSTVPPSVVTLPDGSPLDIDVVYTYVNGSAPSFRSSLQSVNMSYSAQRYRDWSELLYSMRTVYTRGIVPPSGSAARRWFIRKIHLVVANMDHVPLWLIANHSYIHVVTHAEIFPPDEVSHALPTFNSHAIESVLHRIPGLSRFFIYFNNDMFWGRRISFFD